MARPTQHEVTPGCGAQGSSPHGDRCCFVLCLCPSPTTATCAGAPGRSASRSGRNPGKRGGPPFPPLRLSELELQMWGGEAAPSLGPWKLGKQENEGALGQGALKSQHPYARAGTLAPRGAQGSTPGSSRRHTPAPRTGGAETALGPPPSPSSAPHGWARPPPRAWGR